MELKNSSSIGGEAYDRRFADDIDSTCSTPYVSAPSSPGRGPPTTGGYFFSAPASPMHYILSSTVPYSAVSSTAPDASGANSFEFDFSARCPAPPATADELFLNGQIRPMKLSSHLQRPQALAPLIDVGAEEEEEDSVEVVRGRDLRMRSRSLHRRARSMSPLRNSRFHWTDGEEKATATDLVMELDLEKKREEMAAETTPESASASRSSSSGRNSKRWVFLKDLLYRSKSEGRNTTTSKEKFWHNLSFSPASSKDKSKPSAPPPAPATQKKGPATTRPTNGVGKRRVPAPSPHERHYTANRAVAEDMRRRTFLPYRQGLFGCLGFSSRSYGAVNGFARSLNPVTEIRSGICLTACTMICQDGPRILATPLTWLYLERCNLVYSICLSLVVASTGSPGCRGQGI